MLGMLIGLQVTGRVLSELPFPKEIHRGIQCIK